MRISTNIFKNLAASEIREIELFDKRLNEVKVYGYVQKSLSAEEIIKIIFTEFDLLYFLRDAILWELIINFFKFLLSKAKQKVQKTVSVQFWIQDTTGQSPINVTFSSRDDSMLVENLVDFKQTLSKKLPKMKKTKGRITWITYDEKDKKWSVLVL